MKMLFHNGKINEDSKRVGIGKIHFSTNGMDVLDSFAHSLWYISGVLGAYDIEHYKKINDKDMFFFYQTMKFSPQTYRVADKVSIVTALDAIMSDNLENVVNFEHTMIKEAAEGTELNAAMGIESDFKTYVDETIFWDTLNNFVIIIGKDQLEKFAYALEEERHKNYLFAFPNRKIEDFISDENMHGTVKQMIKVAKQDK